MWRGVVGFEICFRRWAFKFHGWWGGKKKREIKDASLVLDLSYWVSDGITDYDCANKKKKEEGEEEKVCRANKVGGKKVLFRFYLRWFIWVEMNEWMCEPVDLYLISWQVSGRTRTPYVLKTCFDPTFRTFLHYRNITQRTYQWTSFKVL